MSELRQDSTAFDIRQLASTTERDVYIDGGLFPVMAEGADGSISAVLRGGSGHLGLNGRIDLIRSQDGGESWAPPAVIIDGPADERNPAYGVSTTGTHILAWYVQTGYREDGKYDPQPGDTTVALSRSHDHGLTWESPRPVDTNGLEGSPYGRIVALADGTLLMPIYTTSERNGHKGGSHFMRSTDDGETWSAPGLIAEGYNETTILVLPDGDLLAALRRTERAVQDLSLARSTDGGATWSEPEQISGPFQHPADLVMLDDETVLLTYGNRRPPYRIEARISRDRGKTWSGQLIALSGNLYGYELAEERPTDFGYPSNVVREDGTVVTVYYVCPFPRVGPNREWSGVETTPFYQSRGYRARCVRWSREELFAALVEP